eukprot:scaffold236953_cov19-Prasinocladus_malaysianus.AAC.1
MAQLEAEKRELSAALNESDSLVQRQFGSMFVSDVTSQRHGRRENGELKLYGVKGWVFEMGRLELLLDWHFQSRVFLDGLDFLRHTYGLSF